MTVKIPEWCCDPPCNRVYYGGPLEQCPHEDERTEVSEGNLLKLISFGYLHGPSPEADRVEDVRHRLRDPAAARDILDLDGRHPRVQDVVPAPPAPASSSTTSPTTRCSRPAPPPSPSDAPAANTESLTGLRSDTPDECTSPSLPSR
jgi:hypothetical protein